MQPRRTAAVNHAALTAPLRGRNIAPTGEGPAMSFFVRCGVAIAALLTAAIPASAADLTMALSSSPSAMDPQFHNLAANINVSANMFDALIRTDADSHILPGLAESWKLIDDHTWEFHLRPGVKFHDGACQIIPNVLLI